MLSFTDNDNNYNSNGNNSSNNDNNFCHYSITMIAVHPIEEFLFCLSL